MAEEKLYRSTIASTLSNLVQLEFPLRICHFSRLRIFSKFSVLLCVVIHSIWLYLYIPDPIRNGSFQKIDSLTFFPFFFSFFLFYFFTLSVCVLGAQPKIYRHDISLRSHFYTKKLIHSDSTFR